MKTKTKIMARLYADFVHEPVGRRGVAMRVKTRVKAGYPPSAAMKP